MYCYTAIVDTDPIKLYSNKYLSYRFLKLLETVFSVELMIL